MRVAVLKLPGVDSVDVSLERALAEIRLRADNTVTLAQIREIVRNNGFTPRDAAVTVVGQLGGRGGKPALTVTGTDMVLMLAPDAKHPAAYNELEARLRDSASRPTELSGVVEARQGQPDILIVRSTSPGRR